MHLLFQQFMSGKPGIEAPSPKRFARASTEFTEKLILWGSDEVVRDWVRLRSEMIAQSERGEKPEPEFLFRWEEFFYTLRKDVGHDNKGLGHGDLLRLFINDLTIAASNADPEQETTE